MVAELLWLELVWLIDWWAGVKVLKQLLISPESFLLLFVLGIDFLLDLAAVQTQCNQ